MVSEEQVWHERVSQPMHRMKINRDVMIPMRDGTRLACDVYLPEEPGQYPALLSYSHYGKDIQRIEGKRKPLSPLRGNGGQEAGDSEYFVSRGYVHVIADARGSGDSEGVYDYQGPNEQRDGYDIVEWMAQQPWCNGNVGMFGMSYFGVVQYMVAAQQPPHLKTIVPYEALTDRYRQSTYHGGMLNIGFWHQWWDHVSVGHWEPLSFNYLDKEEIDRRVSTLMATPEVRDSAYLHIQLKYPEKNPLLFSWLMEPFDGPLYWERSPYKMFDKIKIPTFLATRWTSWEVHLAGAFEAYLGIDAPKKLLLMETESALGPLRPWADHHDLLLRWYDHWLKGNDTGMMDEPPITLLVKGKNVYRTEHEWPLARTKWTKMYLRSDASLGFAPDETQSTLSFSNDPDLPPRSQLPGLVFRSEPFEKETELTGPLALYLHASLSTDEATWVITLKDEASDGSYRILTKGWLRASQREIDPEKSKPYKPYQLHRQREQLTPGEVYEFPIEIRETSNAFLPGHRLVLEVRGQNGGPDDTFWIHLCNPVSTVHTLHLGGEEQSYLLLPVIEQKEE